MVTQTGLTVYIFFDETGVQLSLHGESETSKHNQVIEILSIHQNRICNIVTTKRFPKLMGSAKCSTAFIQSELLQSSFQKEF